MITSKQRAQLRGMANRLDAIFQVGKGGVNDQLTRQIDETLEARELIKVRVLETAPTKWPRPSAPTWCRSSAPDLCFIGKARIISRSSW